MWPSRIAILLVVVLVSSPAHSWAAYFVRASYSYSGVCHAFPDLNRSFQGQHTTVKNSPTNPGIAATDGGTFVSGAFGTYGEAIATGHARSKAQIGKLSVSVEGKLDATNFLLGPVTIQHAFAEASAFASAAWSDTATIRDADRPIGTVFTVTAPIIIDGSLGTGLSSGGFSGGASGLVELSLRNKSGFLLASGQSLNGDPGDDPREGTTHPPGEIDVTWAFVNGVPADLGYNLEVFGRGSASRGYRPPHTFLTGAAYSDFHGNYSRTIKWGGIKSVVVAATGEPVENWTITSESGFDYSKSFVPEPSSIVLLSFGFCAWLGWARPRRGAGRSGCA